MNIATRISEVQIYRSSAAVTRKGVAKLEAGTASVVIEGMSSSAYTDTLRLHFPASVKASSVHVAYLQEDDSKESEKIARKIEAVRKQIEVLNVQTQMYRDIAGLTSLSGSLGELEKYIEAYPERISGINRKIEELILEQKGLEKELNKTCKEENKPLILLSLTAEESGEYPFEVKYQDSAASWDSQYEVHSEGIGTPLEIRARANISQTTGEDWEDVSVALRTGNPSVYGHIPELKPVTLQFKMKTARAVSSARPKMLMAASVNGARDFALEDSAMEDTAQLAPLAMPDADVSTSETMTEYKLKEKYAIRSGSEGMVVDLQSFSLDGEYHILAVPKETGRACLIAEVKTADLPMMISSKAAVYLCGIYTGSTNINPDLNQETFKVYLGEEERIALERIEKKKASEALIRNQQSVDYEYELKISSLKDEDAEVVVIDQIPLSADQQITVDIKNNGKAEYNDKTGELRWKTVLKAGSTQVYKFAYRVTWPKDQTLDWTQPKTYCPVCGAQVYGRFCPECGSSI